MRWRRPQWWDAFWRSRIVRFLEPHDNPQRRADLEVHAEMLRKVTETLVGSHKHRHAEKRR